MAALSVTMSITHPSGSQAQTASLQVRHNRVRFRGGKGSGPPSPTRIKSDPLTIEPHIMVCQEGWAVPSGGSPKDDVQQSVGRLDVMLLEGERWRHEVGLTEGSWAAAATPFSRPGPPRRQAQGRQPQPTVMAAFFPLAAIVCLCPGGPLTQPRLFAHCRLLCRVFHSVRLKEPQTTQGVPSEELLTGACTEVLPDSSTYLHNC